MYAKPFDGGVGGASQVDDREQLMRLRRIRPDADARPAGLDNFDVFVRSLAIGLSDQP
jgi:hypothetical protein